MSLVCGIWLDCRAQQPGQTAALLRDAAQALAAGDLARAETELQSVLRNDSDDYRALELLGMVRAQQQRNREAEQLFERVVTSKPEFVSAHVNLGLLYAQAGELEKAVPQLQEALRLDPSRTDVAAALANLWREQASSALNSNNPEKALSVLLQARKVAPDNPDVQFELGMVALRMSLLPDAVTAFQTTLKLRPDDAMAVYGLGRAYMEFAKFEDARQQFAHYIELRPNDASGHYGLGMSLAALEQLQAARSEFEKSIALAPLQTESYFRLGLLELESKDLDSAAKNLRRVLDRDPKHAGALAAMGRLEFQQKNYSGAVELLQQAVASNAGLREAHYYLGLTYARLGKKEDSEQELQIATRLEHEQTEKQRTVFTILDPGPGPASDPKSPQ
jgi:tetratricopeptide (TPR) repeat protein